MKNPLDTLRREIDAIDDAIHDLLMKRADVVKRVGEAKGIAKNGGNALRPAREAEVLRRLVRRHKGDFPKPALVRIWRELIGGFTAMQSAFSVAVLGEDAGCGLGLLARAHFGSTAPVKTMASARRVIDAVRSGDATVGVLPVPDRSDEAPWWPHLASTDASAPKIVARLPFADGNDEGTGLAAFAISPLAQEKTGDDRCLFVVETAEDIRLSGFEKALAQAGMEARTTALWHDENKPEIWLYLAEIDGCLSPKGAAAARLLDAVGGTSAARVVPLGGYAVPLGAEDMKDERD